MVFSLHFFSPMRYASAKRSVKSKYSTNNRCAKTEDVLCNPENLVNPDSELVTGNIPQKQATLLIFVGNYVRSSQAFESRI